MQQKARRSDPGQQARGELINPLALIFFTKEAECEMIRQAGGRPKQEMAEKRHDSISRSGPLAVAGEAARGFCQGCGGEAAYRSEKRKGWF